MLEGYSFLEMLAFVVIVVLALWADLRAHKSDEVISVKNAAMWSALWVMLALLFAVYVGIAHGMGDASLFLTGYFLEKSLSVDNLFVIMAIFASFSIKDEFQHRVLYYGIIGALILRMIFVAAGASIIAVGGPYALTFFGLFVLWSAYKMWQSMTSEHKEITDYVDHFAVKWTKKFFPVHNKLEGHDFFVKKEMKWHATPLFLCLMTVEMADVMFAFDSVPAILAITQNPFLVYTSNIFAILGLRSLYFLLAAAKRYLCHLEKAVIIILVYIGLKMLITVAGFGHVHPVLSLFIVLGTLAGGIIASYIWPDKAVLGEALEETPQTPSNAEVKEHVEAIEKDLDEAEKVAEKTAEENTSKEKIAEDKAKANVAEDSK